MQYKMVKFMVHAVRSFSVASFLFLFSVFAFIRPPDIVRRRTYILPVFLSSYFFLSFFFFAA